MSEGPRTTFVHMKTEGRFTKCKLRVRELEQIGDTHTQTTRLVTCSQCREWLELDARLEARQ